MNNRDQIFMDFEVEASAMNEIQRVGQEIRDLRKARGLTLAQLVRSTGLSMGFLSQVENGRSSPSITALHSIANALGVTVSWFFAAAPSEPGLEDLVVRKGNRRVLTFGAGISDELLSPNLRRQIELLESHLAPGSTSGTEAYSHQGDEAGIVLKGELELWVGDTHIRLGPGDSFAFESTTPHRYRNPTDEETIVVWAVTPPSY